MSVLVCTGLYRDLLACAGLYWAVLGCNGLPTHSQSDRLSENVGLFGLNHHILAEMCDVTPVTHGGQRSKVENKYSGRPETAKCNFEIKLFVVFGIRGKLMNNRVSVKKKCFFEPWRLHTQCLFV